jgi:hypothetical protein
MFSKFPSSAYIRNEVTAVRYFSLCRQQEQSSLILALIILQGILDPSHSQDSYFIRNQNRLRKLEEFLLYLPVSKPRPASKCGVPASSSVHFGSPYYNNDIELTYISGDLN